MNNPGCSPGQGITAVWKGGAVAVKLKILSDFAARAKAEKSVCD